MCILIIALDSVCRINKNYYPFLVFLEEWKYKEKEIKKPRYIIQDFFSQR